MFNAWIYHTRAKEIRVTLIQVNKPLMFCIVSYWELAADGRTKNTQKLLTQRIPGWIDGAKCLYSKHSLPQLEDWGLPGWEVWPNTSDSTLKMREYLMREHLKDL